MVDRLHGASLGITGYYIVLCGYDGYREGVYVGCDLDTCGCVFGDEDCGGLFEVVAEENCGCCA